MPPHGWSVEHGAAMANRLLLGQGGPASLTWVGGSAADGIALRLRVTPPPGGWTKPAGVRIGGLGAVLWNPATALWRIVDTAGTEHARTAQGELAAAE